MSEAEVEAHNYGKAEPFTPDEKRQRRNLFVRAERALLYMPRSIKPNLITRLRKIATSMKTLSDQGGMSDAYHTAVEDVVYACESLNQALKMVEDCGLLPLEPGVDSKTGDV